ncbi:MBL fold metallo-hydrolase [Sphingomonas profundi]|uniref:MBL fold metallo-hydrolase n=1 Tax=Alterirhizorhabdus profundi TaxID=2681549 RepID=UPI001E5A0388|nr:MBL fold metallo-hydrolase [Sphingomonas profundi]
MRSMVAGALALMMAAAAPGVAAPAVAPAAATPFRLGALRLVALRDASNPVPNDGSVFGKDQGPAAVAGVLKAAGAATDTIALSVDCLLVTLPGRVVLIDTGLGPKAGGALLASLAVAGVRPGAVTDVLITHSHFDHVGGLLAADGTPAFPNATIRMSAPEWAFMQSQDRGKAIAAAIRDKVQPFAPGAQLMPGIRAVALPGHTPGHSGYEIASGASRLIDIGDSAHSAIVSLAEPDWTITYDTDSAAGKAQRRAILTRLAASHEPVFAPHFPFPGVGTVVAKGDGFAWKPGLP